MDRRNTGASGSTGAWAFDLDGVLWTGNTPIPGAAEAVQRLIDVGAPVVFVTNNSYATVAQQEEKLASFGISAEGRVATSAMAGAALIEPGERVYVLGGPGVVEALGRRGATVVTDEEARTDTPDAVLVGLDRELTYHRLSTAVLSIRAGARFLATNTDTSFPSELGLLPGGGAIVSAVSCSTGVDPVVGGKPHEAQARIVRDMVGDRGVMVGDRPETDGLFAVALGYDFGLVLTGVTRREDLPIVPEPRYIAENVAQLVDALSADSGSVDGDVKTKPAGRS